MTASVYHSLVMKCSDTTVSETTTTAIQNITEVNHDEIMTLLTLLKNLKFSFILVQQCSY